MAITFGGANGLSLRLRADPALRVIFSDRACGNMSLVVGAGDPLNAREALLDQIGLAPDDAVFMEQVHGAEAAVVGTADRGRGARAHATVVPGVDALVTADDGVALVVMVADCVPLLLADPGGRIAAVHAGRQGVARGVVWSTLEVLQPADIGNVQAFIGPAIGGCCYEVPAKLRDVVSAVVPEAAASTSWQTPSLDLPAAVNAQLLGAGVRGISRVGGCTRCEPGRWFSHRGVPGEGRQAAVIARRN